MVCLADSAVHYWQLPSGSQLAYVRVPAQGIANPVPLIFVHGGPGAYQVSGHERGRRLHEHLAQHGLDVYLYDQIGSGLSARLANPREYTVARQVEDLEAIRVMLCAQQVSFAGDSWGASLVAHYLAGYPGRVHRVVFTSPGAMHRQDWSKQRPAAPRVGEDFIAWAEQSRGLLLAQRLRHLDAMLQADDIDAAYSDAPDREMDELLDAYVTERVHPTCVHQSDRVKDIASHGMGWWAWTMTNWDAERHDSSPRKALSSIHVRALVLRGASDYLPLEMASQYASTLPNAVLLWVPKAGHFIWLDRPEVYGDAIAAFLLHQPLG